MKSSVNAAGTGDTLRVNEIFYSLQGEGHFTGTPAVFLRLSGCNLRCPFCDTDHSASETLAWGQLLERIAAYPSRHLVITAQDILCRWTPTAHCRSPTPWTG